MMNWSLILNVLLLIGVVFALFRMVHTKHQEKNKRRMYRAEPPKMDIQPHDDIIAVRRLPPEAVHAKVQSSSVAPVLEDDNSAQSSDEPKKTSDMGSLMMFLLAKENRQLAGYELFQTMLAAGLRFGDGQLFHRHQFSNGQGPIICSLAAATESGVFDLQNMGTFSVRGLCLFMESSANAGIDAERLAIMLDTAKQLSESLDTYLLDDERVPWSDSSLARYQQLLNITSEEAVCV
jgi:cell division protein ZipA